MSEGVIRSIQCDSTTTVSSNDDDHMFVYLDTGAGLSRAGPRPSSRSGLLAPKTNRFLVLNTAGALLSVAGTVQWHELQAQHGCLACLLALVFSLPRLATKLQVNTCYGTAQVSPSPQARLYKQRRLR